MNKSYFHFHFLLLAALSFFDVFRMSNGIVAFAGNGSGNVPIPCWLEQKKVGDYTYQQELKAERAEQLVNKAIVPQTVIKNGKTTVAAAGEVRILIGSDMINFKGVSSLGVFSIVGKEKVAGKWVLRLNDVYKEETQELNILLDNNNFVQSVQLKSRNYGDIVFKLPTKTAAQLQTERQYYSPKSAILVRAYPDLFGKRIAPIRRIQQINANDLRDDKITMDEQLSFSFDNENITLNIGRQTTVLKVKNVAIEPLAGKEKAVKCLVIQTSKQPTPVKIWLNGQNQIEGIEWGDMQYLLAP